MQGRVKVNPAIVVPCFDKELPLKRLLKSLLAADYSGQEVPIVFSVDYNGSERVFSIVEGFSWPYGPKEVIRYETNIGLRKNIINCGSLSEKYGSVIILEDDLFVSKNFYRYACETQKFYEHDSNIAGVSLYSYDYCELNEGRFYPLNFGTDTYFMQWASSWGQLWTKKQWDGFYAWYEENKNSDLSAFDIPASVIEWAASSWKKYFIAYLVATSKYFVYPYKSYVTNCADDGAHVSSSVFIDKQVNIPYDEEFADSKFAEFTGSFARYDCFYELQAEIIKRLSQEFANYDFTVDLHSNKALGDIRTEFLLSSKVCSNPIRSFDKVLVPLTLNVLHDLDGDYIKFGLKDNFVDNGGVFHDVMRYQVNREVFSVAKSLKFSFVRIFNKIKSFVAKS